MIEVIDGASFEVIGCKYTAEERAAALFSLGLYGDQLAAGSFKDDAVLLRDKVDLTTRLKQSLADEPDVFAPGIHRILRTIYFPYVDVMERRLYGSMLTGVCRTLGIAPFDLLSHAITARSIIDGKMTDQEFVSFDPGPA